MNLTLLVSLVLFCALLGSIGQLFFKMASKEFSLNPLTWLKNIKFLIGITLYAISAILFVWALKYGKLSLLYPIIASSYVWTVLFAKLFLQETVTLYKWLGISLIIGGIVLIVLK